MPTRQTIHSYGTGGQRGSHTLKRATYLRRPLIDINRVAAAPSQPKNFPRKEQLKHTSVPGSQLSLEGVRGVRPLRSRTVPHPASSKPALFRQKPSVVLHRSGFVGKGTYRKAFPKPKRHQRSQNFYVARGLVLLIFLLGLGVSVNTWHDKRISKTQIAVLAKTTNSDDNGSTPSEQELAAYALASHQVAPDQPRLLTIPKIQINTRVQRLGVKPNNELRSPGNIFDAGWYEGSSKPGEKGTIVLNGYVLGPTKHGVFYSLANLRENDVITLERGDGTTFRYKVVKQEVYDYDNVNIPALLTSAQPGKPGLNIITSDSRFDVRTNTFEKRTVIFAVQD